MCVVRGSNKRYFLSRYHYNNSRVAVVVCGVWCGGGAEKSVTHLKKNAPPAPPSAREEERRRSEGVKRVDAGQLLFLYNYKRSKEAPSGEGLMFNNTCG
jgi:hypothetical protein